MQSNLANIRRVSLAIGVMFVSFGVAPQAHAADTAMQRVALACTQAEASHCPQAAARHATPQRAGGDIALAKAQPRRSLDARVDAAQDNDGSRFRYDSCGCSND
jgi:hypothetical protein